MTARLTGLIEWGQHEGYVPAIDLVHAKFIFSDAFVLPIVMAAEYRLVSDVDALNPAFADRHIEKCLRLFLPTLASPRKGRADGWLTAARQVPRRQVRWSPWWR